MRAPPPAAYALTYRTQLQHLPSAAAQIRDRDAALAQQFFTAEPSPRLGGAFAPPAPLPLAMSASTSAPTWTAAGHVHVTPPPSARWASEFAIPRARLAASRAAPADGPV
jgi:hypothetical protein